MAKSFKEKAKEIIQHYSSTPWTGCSDKGSEWILYY